MRETASRGRPPIITRERLLEVAREVFLERGVRATTAEVAKRAKVSEGTVFHRFHVKEALFREAMRFDPSELPERMSALLEGMDELPLEVALEKMARGLLAIARVALPLIMMSWSNPSSCEIEGRKGAEYLVVAKRFGAFFERKMDAGELRRTSPEVLTRMFIGSMHHFCMTELTTKGTGYTLGEEAFVRGLVDVLLHGTVASAPPTARASARRLKRA